MEMSAHYKKLVKTAEWYCRRTGAVEMQQAVLRWAVAHRTRIQAMGLVESLITVMNQQIAAVDADKPTNEQEAA